MNMPQEFEFVEQNAPETGGDISWYGKEDQTEDQSIHDRGKGEPVVVRVFEFKFNPDLKKLPTKEELLTPSYIKALDGELWGDALRRVAEPRIHIDKKGCKIFVACQAAAGHSHLEEPKLLQEWL